MADLRVDLNGLHCVNPVMTASGTFGNGLDYTDFYDPSLLGAVIVKGTTLEPREGNLYPRMAEVTAGMLNAVGLQNKGVDYLMKHHLPLWKGVKTNIIVNVSGSSVEDYVATAKKLASTDIVPAIELNISCPNVKKGGIGFGTSVKNAAEVVRQVRAIYPYHLMVKLTPNVTDITEIARAVEAEGADSVSMVNTFMGMAIDAATRRPKLSTVTGGLSGPCIKPIALRMVWQTAKAIRIPIVGLGGIMNATDAVEFLLAGASAVQIGTANFIDPMVGVKVVEGIEHYLDRQGCQSVKEIIGGLIC